MNEHQILVTEKDMLRITNLLSAQVGQDYEDLELELDRAKIIPDDMAPADLVTMNTKFSYLNLQEDKETTITIVYPGEANFEQGKVSVLAPLGSALIGLRVGQAINWMFPGKKTRTLKITKIHYQPEASGDWHL